MNAWTRRPSLKICVVVAVDVIEVVVVCVEVTEVVWVVVCVDVIEVVWVVVCVGVIEVCCGGRRLGGCRETRLPAGRKKQKTRKLTLERSFGNECIWRF